MKFASFLSVVVLITVLVSGLLTYLYINISYLGFSAVQSGRGGGRGGRRGGGGGGGGGGGLTEFPEWLIYFIIAWVGGSFVCICCWQSFINNEDEDEDNNESAANEVSAAQQASAPAPSPLP